MTITECDQCHKRKVGNHRGDWHILWQEDLIFCSWQCLANFADLQSR